MAELEEDIRRVNDKLQQLLKQYVVLQKDNARLQANQTRLVEESEMKTQQIEQLRLQVALLKTAAGQMSDADKRDFERKLNQYIKDIDKCITLLSE